MTPTEILTTINTKLTEYKIQMSKLTSKEQDIALTEEMKSLIPLKAELEKKLNNLNFIGKIKIANNKEFQKQLKIFKNEYNK